MKDIKEAIKLVNKLQEQNIKLKQLLIKYFRETGEDCDCPKDKCTCYE